MSTQLAERPKVKLSGNLSEVIPETASYAWDDYEIPNLVTENAATTAYYKELVPVLDRDLGEGQIFAATSGTAIVPDAAKGGLEELVLRVFISERHQHFEIQEVMRRVADRVAQETPITVKSPRVSLQIDGMRLEPGPAQAALERADQLRSWYQLTWADLAKALGVDEATFFNWRKKPNGTPRPISVAQLDSFWGFSRAVHERMDADGFRQWSVAPVAGDRSPKQLLKEGDLEEFRRATRAIVRPRRSRSQRPKQTGIGAWSPEFDD